MDYTSYGPGTLAFIIVAGIGLALFFLLKSMNRQIAKIQPPDDGHENGARVNGGDK
ncbi:hypothetical protein [Sphaerimonospora thailandensis]|uniref:Uncharacterized protein n=1 Tax=Sphaerimonospora thailandensis TaxID=795644 RepID=A0A8J3R7B9_9ACTN|nr:hypothetical protein [Sphaerimonospora thailandensis]GIH69180.1 hypothetical protein Mth01_14330 [Sphaerimonospora thailandensis]